MINGANSNFPNHFPTVNHGGGFKMAANYGGGIMQAAHQHRGPQVNDLWCLPVQNFRIDGGSTNLYSQKVTIDWPEFRPQHAVFSGPRVKQDTTNIFANPGSNFNFDDCGYSNFSGGFIGGGFPGVGGGFGGGMGGGFPGMGGAKGGFGGGFPHLGGGFPNMGMPNLPGLPNLPDFPDFPFPGSPKGDIEGGVKEAKKSLSGKGTIDGANFRSGDGERYELKVEAGKSYNLLSDAGIGLNGTYGTVAGETVLTDIALSVGGKIVTLANDGTLRVDGKAFDKRKNNLEGLVTENKDGTYTVKSNGYEFELKASQNGIRVKIDAKNARTPEGLWGVALDGEKNTEKQLQKAIKESDYRIDDALTFDYEDNNNIGEKYTPDLDDEERANLAWNARNPKGDTVRLFSWGDGRFGVNGPIAGDADRIDWSMRQLANGKVYNVFSDEGIQVNGKYKDGKLQELGFVLDGDEVKITRGPDGFPVVTVNDTKLTSGSSGPVTIGADRKVTIRYGDSDDENYTFEVNKNSKGEGLDLNIVARNIGANETRSTGLLGDAFSGNLKDNGNDNNGAGYLRNEDGSLSKAGASMTKALREYLVDDLFDTSSGRSVYE